MRVRRTGGFAGLVADGEVDLDGDDAAGARGAPPGGAGRPAAVAAATPRPDMYVYDFDLCGDPPRSPSSTSRPTSAASPSWC